MRYREILEDYPITDEFKKQFVAHLADYFGREEDEWVEYEFESWYEDLSKIHDHGGKVYRVVFVNDISEVRTDDLGTHWSTRELDDSALERLRNDAEHQFRVHGDRTTTWAKCIQITAQIPANNITIQGINLPEEWTEYEVNLLDPTKITILDMKEING